MAHDTKLGAMTEHGLLLEEGTAFARLSGLTTRAASTGAGASTGTGGSGDALDVIVIGAGQAGLSVGYHLKKRGLRFVILDGNARIGDNWRTRWDSLRLFTPARFDSLPGMRFPAHGDAFPTKDEMGDYLEAYAERFALPVATGARVHALFREDGLYVVHAGTRRFLAPQVVIAMASYQKPRVPEFARELDPGVTQLHSFDYRNPSQLRPGPVLVVGAGNSGSEIALELSRTHRVLLSGRDTGHVPFRPSGFFGRVLLVRLTLRVMFHHVLTVRTPLGRKLRPKVLTQGGPLIRVKPKDLAAAGVERVARTEGTRDGLPLLQDGRVLQVENVVFCTGFHPGCGFVQLPVFDAQGQLRHERGVVEGAPGLYAVGVNFLYSLSSGMVHGVGRDAGRIAGIVKKRALAARHERVAA